MLKRFFITLSFKGSEYHGWQIQKNAQSVQSTLNSALSLILQTKIEVIGAGRTDTGVHAKFFVAHFDIQSKKFIFSYEDLIFKLNNFLPYDIAVHNIFEVKTDAHARFSAISRTYCYYISRNKNPFKNDFTYYLYGKLDVNKMNQAAALLLENKDFVSFSKSGSDNSSTLCDVTYAKWEEKNDMLIFTITANRFLRNMVRSIVGTLIDVGKGKVNITEFKKIINSKNRSNAGFSVPACGLFLENISYPDNIYL